MSEVITTIEATPESASTLDRGLTALTDSDRSTAMADPTDERWLPIAGYEGYYEVSDQGRVRSLDRIGRGNRGQDILYRGRVLKPGKIKYGHLWVRLYRDGIGEQRWVHRLVAETFIGACPVGMEVCHNDGDPSNNVPSNLRFDTHQGNMADSTRQRTHRNSRKETCPRGHVYDRMYPSGRRCSICDAEREKRRVR